MRAGALRNRCVLQKRQRIPDGAGGGVEGWSDVGELWAEITMPTGRVATVADQLTSLVTAEIRIRPRSDVFAQMRLVHKTTTYMIEAVLPDNERSMLRLLCSNVPQPRGINP